MKKKVARGFCFVLIFALLLESFVNANSGVFPSDSYIHRADYYAVSFDGEGDAIVRAKLVIENTSEKPIKELYLQMPENTKIYYIVQEMPDFNKLKFTTERLADYLIVKVQLANEIKEGEQAKVVLIYKIPNLAKRDLLGNFNFEFKTLVDRKAILTEKVRVAINVQPEFYLKGAQSKVNYKPDFFSEAKAMEIGKALPYYKRYYDIEYAKGLVKEAYSLDQFESFSVRGSYSENLIALYLSEILLSIVIIGGIIVLVIHAVKRFCGKKKLASIMQNGFFAVIAVSFLDALALIFLSFLLTAIGEGLFRYTSNPFLALLFIFITMISLAFVMMLPAYWIYKRHSIVHAIATVLLTLVCLFVVLYAYSVLFYRPRILYELAIK